MWLIAIALSFSLAQSAPATTAEIPIDTSIQTCGALVDARQEAFDSLMDLQKAMRKATCPSGQWFYINEEAGKKRVCKGGETIPPKSEAKAMYEKSIALQARTQSLQATQEHLTTTKTIDNECRKQLTAQTMKHTQAIAGNMGVEMTDAEREKSTQAMNAMVDFQTCAKNCMETHREDNEAMKQCAQECGDAVKAQVEK
jgi:hypothetical protein